MNTTQIMKGEIAKAAKDDGTDSFLDLYAGDTARFDMKLTQQWQAYYERLSHGYPARTIADRCQCALNTVKKWNKEIPYHREHYVMIGCCYGLTVEEVSRLMSRYGGFSRLHSDSLDDIRFIRLLQIMQDRLRNNRGDLFDIPSAYADLNDSYYAEESRIQSRGLWSQRKADMTEGSLLKTEKDHTQPDPLFYDMIFQSQKILISSYHEVSKTLTGCVKRIGFKTNSAFYARTKMSSSMQRIFSAMNTEVKASSSVNDFLLKPMPWRRQLIAFGLYLGMPLEYINQLLKKANMEELCPRDPYEASLLFVLQQLYYKDKRYAGKEMLGKENLAVQEDLQYLYNNHYFGLFGYVYSKLSVGDLAAFLKGMDVDLNKAMCI